MTGVVTVPDERCPAALMLFTQSLCHIWHRGETVSNQLWEMGSIFLEDLSTGVIHDSFHVPFKCSGHLIQFLDYTKSGPGDPFGYFTFKFFAETKWLKCRFF